MSAIWFYFLLIVIEVSNCDWLVLNRILILVELDSAFGKNFLTLFRFKFCNGFLFFNLFHLKLNWNLQRIFD